MRWGGRRRWDRSICTIGPVACLTIRSDTGYSAEVRQEARFAPGKGLAGYVYKTGRLWNVRDTRTRSALQAADQNSRSSSLHHRRAACAGAAASWACCAWTISSGTHAFSEESEKLLTLFAGEVAPWLENARLVDILRDLHDTIIDLLDLSSPDMHPLFEAVAERLLHDFDLNGCAIGHRESPYTVRFAVRHGLPDLPETIELAALPARLQEEVLTPAVRSSSTTCAYRS